MRIPFVPKDIEIEKERYDFISQYRGGGFMLIAGSIYWFLSFALTYFIHGNALNNFYIWGGLLTPILGFVIFKLLKLKIDLKTKQSKYTSLVAFASAITVCCFPIFILINQLDSSMILPIICIVDATHLLIICWIHLEYLYFINFLLGEIIGLTFIYYIPHSYVHFICLIWGLISLVSGVVIHFSKSPLSGYNYKIGDIAKNS